MKKIKQVLYYLTGGGKLENLNVPMIVIGIICLIIDFIISPRLWIIEDYSTFFWFSVVFIGAGILMQVIKGFIGSIIGRK